MSKKGLGRGEFFILIAFLVFAIVIIVYFAVFQTAFEFPKELGGEQETEPDIRASSLSLTEKNVPGLFRQSTDKNISSQQFISQIQGLSSFEFEQFYSGWQTDFVAQTKNQVKGSYSILEHLTAVTDQASAKKLLDKVRDETNAEEIVDLNQIEDGLEEEFEANVLLIKKQTSKLTYYQLHLQRGPLYSYLFIAGTDPSHYDAVLYGLSADKKMKNALNKEGGS